ncbi:MBL fold metallo-hydrolase [Cohnella caldifontis]|uniref:MBL fold metallo-hydrolase n=1 Tax=Cohnella caldifontis TaxID=3027471 RepID=UPI0023EC173C|nr:MBL fold metallo-hydrolase [Cohnella sp. YIM B05605]
MDLLMLGTGGGFYKKLYPNNALLDLNGYRLLIDCGSTATRSLHELGLSWEKDIDGVLVTHLHSGHVGGLEEIALDGKFKYKKKIDLFAAEDLLDPLWEHCLKGGTADGPSDRLDDFFNVKPMKHGETVSIHGMPAELVRTLHVPGKSSSGLRIGPLYYSSDAQFDERLLLELQERVRFIFHDCSLEPARHHASLDQLATLPESVQEKIRLMHYSDDPRRYLAHGRIGKMRLLEQHVRYSIS